jgi:polyhydroxyalkanoate synthase
MGLLDRLRSLLGRDDRQTRRQQGGSANVTVEHDPEPAPETEAAVKGTGDADDHSADGPAVDTGADTTTDAGSTTQPNEQETRADEPAEPAEPETTAEPAEPDEPEGSDSEEPVDSINGIGPTYAERLEAAGIGTVEDLAATDAETVAEAAETAESRVTDWVEQAQNR